MSPDPRKYCCAELFALCRAGIDPDSCGNSIDAAQEKQLDGWERAKSILKQIENEYYSDVHEENDQIIDDGDFGLYIDRDYAAKWKTEAEVLTNEMNSQKLKEEERKIVEIMDKKVRAGEERSKARMKKVLAGQESAEKRMKQEFEGLKEAVAEKILPPEKQQRSNPTLMLAAGLLAEDVGEYAKYSKNGQKGGQEAMAQHIEKLANKYGITDKYLSVASVKRHLKQCREYLKEQGATLK